MATITENKVIIAKGTLANYNLIETKDSSTLYFTTDTDNTSSLYLGETLIGSNVKDVAYDSETSKLTITKYNPVTGEPDPIVLSFADVASAEALTAAVARIATLEGVGAEANVQVDWNETVTTSDAFILNKPTSMPASDVYDWAKASAKPTYTASEVGAATEDYVDDAIADLGLEEALAGKVDVDGDKVLSTNDYTDAEKTKLAGIASNAEVNVQADWSVTDTTSDAYINNKPTSMPASDVYDWAKASTKPTYTASEVGAATTSDITSAIADLSLADTYAAKDDLDTLQASFDTLVNGNVADTIESFSEVIDFLDGVSDEDTLTGVLLTKQDKLTAGDNITIAVDEDNDDALTISASTAADVTAAISDYSTRITAAEGDIDALESGLSTAEGEIDTLQSSLSTAEGEIDTLQSSLSTAEGEIDTLQSSLSTAEGEIDTLQSSLSTAEGDIDALESKVETLEAKDDATYWHSF